MMAISPTQRTLKRMKESGDYKEGMIKVVERWNPFARIRQDLWNFDIMGISITGETHLIQVTTYGNMNSRIDKITNADCTPHLRDADYVLLVEGWKKVNNRWKSFIADLS